MRRFILPSLLCLFTVALAGCGNKGPLYLPSAQPPMHKGHKVHKQAAQAAPLPATSSSVAPASSSVQP